MNENIYLILIITLELLNYLLIYKVFFHARLKDNKCWLLCLLAVYAIVFWIKAATDNDFPESFLIFIGIIIPFTCFKGNIKDKLFIYPIVPILSSVLSVFVGYIFALYHEETYEKICSEYIPVLLAEMIPSISMLYILISNNCKKIPEIEITIGKKQYILLYSCAILSVCVMGLSQRISSGNSMTLYKLNLYGLAMTGVCMLCLVYALWNGIIMHNKQEQEYRIEQLNTFICLQERQFDTIIKSDEKLRAYRHDMQAHLLALQAMCHDKHQPELAEYIRKNITESEIFHTISYTGNVAIDAILQNLREEAEKRGITVDYQCRTAKNNPVSLYDLCTILSNLLDNAIEANQNVTGEKKISLKIYSINEKLCITVTNTTSHTAVIKDGVLLTDKNEKYHGIGSRNVKKVINSYNRSIEYKNGVGKFSVEIFL